MVKKTERLAFYCELCNNFIESNICPKYGIDYVTIKKIPMGQDIKNIGCYYEAEEKQSAGEDDRLNGMRQIGQRGASSEGIRETRLATSDGPQGDALLPVLPADLDEGKSLQPISQEPPDSPESPEPPEDELPDFAPLDDDYFFEEEATPEKSYEQPAPRVEQPQYDEEIEIPEFYTTDARTVRPPKIVRQGKDTSMLLTVLAMLLVASVGAAGYYFFSNQGKSATALYTEAENAYSSQNFQAALSLYNEFVDNYPKDPLVTVVKGKINKLNKQASMSSLSAAEVGPMIQEMMLKASVAFEKEQYVAPENENAVHYLKRILQMDPHHEPAMAMQQRIIDYYDALAEESKAAGDLNGALGHYQTLLEIKPTDAGIRGKIHAILTQKGQTARN